MEDTLHKFVEHMLPGGLSFLLGFIGFWISVGKNIVTKNEVEQMIILHSPYTQDKQYIMERLNLNKEMQAQFAEALSRNTEVMNDLKVQIATLANTLKTIEYRINE
jgi:hypothetical protein